MIDWNAVVAASPSQVSTAIGDEVAILELERGVYFGLDPIGAFVWSRIESGASVQALHAALIEAYDVSESVAREDLLRLLGELRDAGLIVVGDAVAA